MAWGYVAAAGASALIGALMAPDPPEPYIPEESPYANLAQPRQQLQLPQIDMNNTPVQLAPVQIQNPNSMFAYRQLARAYMQTGMG